MAPESIPQQCAVLIDGSALFFAIRESHPDEALDYDALIDVLVEKYGEAINAPKEGEHARLLRRPDVRAREHDLPGRPIWIMWTSASPHNEAQVRFLSFIEGKLGIDVRRFSPVDSMPVDAQFLAASSAGPRLADRLTRFDASISYMIGRLATTHQLIVVSDSFALAEPMVRADFARSKNPAAGSGPRNVLAFFGRALDPRWHGFLHNVGHEDSIEFLDLDLHEEWLFGGRKAKVKSEVRRAWWSRDIPGNPQKRLKE